MPLPDILNLLHWWFFLFLLGIVFLPFASLFFSRFFDKGYIFAKTLGIATVSFIAFSLGSLHALPFTRLSLFFIVIVCAIVMYYLLRKYALAAIKQNRTIIIVEELLFLGGIFLWTYVRSFEPSIHGLEKYMDYGFINSILRAEFFPPKDMWLTPMSINYYYFGHLATAVLTKFSGLPSNITYNLMLATIFSLCLTSAFSIGSNLFAAITNRLASFDPKSIVSGILTAILVAVAGNLHVFYAFFKPYENENPVPIWELAFLPFSFPNSYWYPNATRFIYNTIHEFPMYSWVVADLHGHVLDIPFVLLTLASVLVLCLHYFDDKKDTPVYSNKFLTMLSGRLPLHISHLIYLSFLLGIMYMTNAWDGLIYMLLTLFLVATIACYQNPLQKHFFQWAGRISLTIITSMVIIGIGFFIFTLPFSRSFDPSAIVSGVGVLCAPKFLTDIGQIGPLLFEKEHCQHSLWWQLLILYGFFYFFIFSYLAFISNVKKTLASDFYILLLIFLGTILILLPEFVYMKDIYPAHYRANTMFKLVFQAFIMLAIVSGYTSIRIVTSFKQNYEGRKAWYSPILLFWVLFSGLLVTIVSIYPFLATKSYYNELKEQKGIDGTAYLRELYPSDYSAIRWINANIKNQPVILEAQGDSYTDYARVSSNTGLPTVLGWTVHEWLWRGSYDIPAPRIEEVKKLYESTDIEETKNLIKKYNIELIFLGDLEREKYPSLNEGKFTQLAETIYQNGNTRILRVVQ